MIRDGRAIGPVDAVLVPGSVTVLTGPSGSGKSSVLAAIRGAIPAAGSVALPGDDRVHPNPERDATGALADRAPFITWMDQRPRLVRGTVAENVTLGAGEPGAASSDPATVRASLRSAGLSVDLDLELGVGGTGLSSGQSQLVALARALYRVETHRTPIVLLDEPTSALDVEAEERVIAALRRLADGGAVVLVASHRPAVTDAADHRIHLGSAVESHAALPSAPPGVQRHAMGVQS